jgi:cysteine desulfurase family protein (TIGR01976 family)
MSNKVPLMPDDLTTTFPESDFPTEHVRRQFPALSREINGEPVVYFDGPAGSQTPVSVADAVRGYLLRMNANHGGVFATSLESDALLAQVHQAVSDFLGADDPNCTLFGANMTTLTFALSRSLARTWKAGDEVLVTRLDHDANVTPWILAARDAGVTVKYVEIHPEDCTLDLDDLRRKLSSRTRLVAVGCASNAVGTINPVREITALAHDAGALVFLDAVHYAPHAVIDVQEWDCDFLTCSAYKFFGPHVGILWGKRRWLEELEPFKVRPAANTLPDRWMTGTQNHEGIAGVLAAIDYLAGLSPRIDTRRRALVNSFDLIRAQEKYLTVYLLNRLDDMREVKLWGIRDVARTRDRVPTFAITHRRHSSQAVAEHLAKRGIFVWHGNFYALALTEALGLEPDGLVRIGLLHYNTTLEVQRLLTALSEL